MDSFAVDIRNLSYAYGKRQALNNLSFTLHPGQFLGLIGPNGAGKSTLLALMTRLLTHARGEIAYFGKSLNADPGQALAKIGVVFQQSTLDLDLSVRHNLYYHGALHGISKRELLPRIHQELSRFGLEDRLDDKIRTLNGGHRRRVELVRALLHRPSLLLLDEATANLDIESRIALNHHVRDLCRERKLAVLWTSHLIDEIQESDEVLILNKGTQAAWGNCREMLQTHKAVNLLGLFQQTTGAGA